MTYFQLKVSFLHGAKEKDDSFINMQHIYLTQNASAKRPRKPWNDQKFNKPVAFGQHFRQHMQI